MSELAKMILIWVLLANVVFLVIVNIVTHRNHKRRCKDYQTSLDDLKSSKEALYDVLYQQRDEYASKAQDYNKLKKEYDALKEIKDPVIKIARYSLYPETFRAIVRDDISGPDFPDQYIVEAIKEQLINEIYKRGLIDIRRLDVVNDRLEGNKTYCAELKVFAEKEPDSIVNSYNKKMSEIRREHKEEL